MTKKTTKLLFAIYIIVLARILLFKFGVHFSYMANRNINLIPFHKMGTLEATLNIIIFIPLGVYACMLFCTWTNARKLIFFVSLSVLVELLQYSFRIGAFDTTDILTNTTGALIGLGLFKLTARLFGNSARLHVVLNVIGAVGTILLVSFLVLLRLDMLPIKYH